MSGVAPAQGQREQAHERPTAPRLRLLPKRTAAAAHNSEADAPLPRTRFARKRASTESHNQGLQPSVLIVGADAARRGQVRDEMSGLMPPGTRFEELGAFWQVLERAPCSRMVILSGDLDELSAESLLHSLAHRHPDLPVVSLESAAAQLR